MCSLMLNALVKLAAHGEYWHTEDRPWQSMITPSDCCPVVDRRARCERAVTGMASPPEGDDAGMTASGREVDTGRLEACGVHKPEVDRT